MMWWMLLVIAIAVGFGMLTGLFAGWRRRAATRAAGNRPTERDGRWGGRRS